MTAMPSFIPSAFVAVNCIHKLGQLVGVNALQTFHR